MTVLRLAPSVRGSTTTVDAHIGAKIEHSIYYQVEGDILPDESGAGNAALVGFLPYAMRYGLDVHVAGPVDFDLLRQLDEAQDAWALWYPRLFRPAALSADEVRPASLPRTDTAVAAFSGGLDSSYALHAHKRGLIGRRALDVRFAALVRGFDLPLDRDDWFADAKRRAVAILDNYDCPLVTVRTNWRSLDLPWELVHIFALASVLHPFKGRVDHGVIAADRAYNGEITGEGTNSTANPMMSGTSFPIHFTGTGKWRTQKAMALRNEPAVYRNLRVCWERPSISGNCGKCEKCIRTKLDFMAVGLDDLSALGGPATLDEIRGVQVKREVVLNLFRDLAAYPWPDRPEIKAALQDLVARGLPDQSRRPLAKIRRWLRKRGLLSR